MVTSLKPKEFLMGFKNVGEILPDTKIRINAQGLIEIKSARIGIEIIDSLKTENFKNKNGWWQTGDLGEINQINNSLYLNFLGRSDNAFNSGGEIVFPEVIESRLNDFIMKENIPINKFNISKVTDKLWGNKIKIIGISSNVIRTKSGGGNTLFIDPYPDGLDSDGMVIIKGSLQVDGTTTTVNSTNTSLNDPIMNIGDVTSKRTVTSTVGSGVSAITLDSVVGINTGDVISGSDSLPGAGTTTINSYTTQPGGTGIGTIFIDGQTTAGITTTSQLTITHGFDTNTDRGITFNYNTSTGVSNNKLGFFGFDDSRLAVDGSRMWTYVPDATNTGNVISGTKGFLDIRGIYFQPHEFAASGNGIVYADSTGRSLVSAGSTAGITTSNFILTTDASGVPKWTTTIDGGQF